ncbi:MAG: GGDEF domain-containing protein [Hyphomicrobiales bacterium]
MNKPPALNMFLLPSGDGAMGSVETPTVLRIIRPATFALWFIIFCAEAVTVASGESASKLVMVLSTLLFAGVHIQFWYEESEQGRRVHHALERMRGRIYEDDLTGLPNSRHFVFELRRQMMRSVRNGRAFSLLLTDLAGMEREPKADERLLPQIAKALRQASAEGDFLAHLEGTVFAAIVADEKDRAAADKAQVVLMALGSCIPLEQAAMVHPVVSLTGYQGELEVRDFLRRAQRDLIATRARGVTSRPVTPSTRSTSNAA